MNWKARMLKSLNELNGWKRLFVVFAIASFFYQVGGKFIQVSNEWHTLVGVKHEVIEGFNDPACAVLVNSLVEGRSQIDIGPDNNCYALFIYRNYFMDSRDTVDGFLEQKRAYIFSYTLGTVGVELLFWAILMMLVYLGGLLFAWVLKGFSIAK
jgi:hypothetical protein